MICDAHCHFFSARFLEVLTQGMGEIPDADRAGAISAKLNWDPPGTVEALADRWVAELDRHGVARAGIIASVPGDEGSVQDAVRRHPERFVGFFMFNPAAGDVRQRLPPLLEDKRLRVVALFPAMHKYRPDDAAVDAVFEICAEQGAAVFVHCGVLSVGVRTRLGLPSPFDVRFGDPLAAAIVAARHPSVPVIIPHFGAGLFREALMAADQCANIFLDTSSSNGWIKYHPGLSLEAVFRQALAVVGQERLLFGTDSSFFPRGWQKNVYDAQVAALAAVNATHDARSRIMGGNFDRLFPMG
jgi:predicted TIM-barrel fold metal-dependent hydrolase